MLLEFHPRWIGGKTLAQVAASRLEELVLIHSYAIHGSCQAGSAWFSSHHLYLLQGFILEDGVMS